MESHHSSQGNISNNVDYMVANIAHTDHADMLLEALGGKEEASSGLVTSDSGLEDMAENVDFQDNPHHASPMQTLGLPSCQSQAQTRKNVTKTFKKMLTQNHQRQQSNTNTMLAVTSDQIMRMSEHGNDSTRYEGSRYNII